MELATADLPHPPDPAAIAVGRVVEADVGIAVIVEIRHAVADRTLREQRRPPRLVEARYRATLSGNSSSVGGAIDNHDGTLSITASTLSGNFANGVHGGAGGAIHTGGLAGTVKIVGSTIAANIAAWEGGGIYTGSGTVTLSNSTIADNTSTCDFGGCSGGGGIYTNSAPVTIESSTLSNNTSRLGGSIISLYTTTTVRNSVTPASNRPSSSRQCARSSLARTCPGSRASTW